MKAINMNMDHLVSFISRNDVVSLQKGLAEIIHHGNFDINDKLENGRTLLAMAARDGKVDCVEALLQANADPNVTNENGTSPLMYAKTHAFASGWLDIMDILIRAGANVNHTDIHGKTAAEYTKERADMLLEYFQRHT